MIVFQILKGILNYLVFNSAVNTQHYGYKITHNISILSIVISDKNNVKVFRKNCFYFCFFPTLQYKLLRKEQKLIIDFLYQMPS